MDTNNTDNKAASVQKMTGLIDYQENSIVSRVLLQTPQGSVTLFAIWNGQRISEHTTPYDALVLVLEGGVDISIGGNVHRLSGGDTVVMPGGVPHALSATGNMKMVLTMIKK